MSLEYQLVENAREKDRLTFEDIDLADGYAPVANGYADLQWDNFFVYSADDLFPGGPKANPYQIGAVSGDQAIVNGYAEPAAISVEDGTFAIYSARLTATYDRVLTADIYGYRDGVEVHHETVKLSNKESTLVSLKWTDVDDVVFYSTHGKHDMPGNQMIIDNLKVAVPPSADASTHFDAGRVFANAEPFPSMSLHTAGHVDQLGAVGVALV